MKIIIFSATSFEMAPLRAFLEQETGAANADIFYLNQDISVRLVVTGVGAPIAMHRIATSLFHENYTHALQMGIAGAFPERGILLGDVVQVAADTFADIGAEDCDGAFLSAQSLGFGSDDVPPFERGFVYTKKIKAFENLKMVSAITVNTASGTAATIAKWQQFFPEAELETMEGAAFLFAARQAKIPNIVQLRGISNYIAPRDRNSWQIKTAIEAVNAAVINWLF